jgi:hypothetical protein
MLEVIGGKAAGPDGPGSVFRMIVAFVLTMSAVSIFAGTGNFKKGDIWEYAIQKTFSTVFASYSRIRTITTGKAALFLDSITKKTDTTFWYVTKTESLWGKETGMIDSGYIPNSSYHHTIFIVNDTMHGNDSIIIFFSFYNIPDSTDTSTLNIRFQRKTDTRAVPFNNMRFSAFVRTVDNESNCGGLISVSSRSSNDTIVWLDSVGLYQKMSHRNFTKVDNIETNSDDTYERYTLTSHNGTNVTVTPAAIAQKGNNPQRGVSGIGKSSRFFDVQGKALSGRSTHFINHCIIIQQFPNGHCVITQKGLKRDGGN